MNKNRTRSISTKICGEIDLVFIVALSKYESADKIHGMKKFLSRSWLWIGVASLVCFTLCPYVGWYAIGTVAVFGGGVYTVKKASDRKNKILNNTEVFSKMTRKQRDAFLVNDQKEVRSIGSISKMMPYVCFVAVLLNCYTYYYNTNAQIEAVGIAKIIPTSMAMPVLIAGVVLWILFFIGFSFRMNETKIDEEQIVHFAKSEHSLLNQSVRAKKGKIKR